MKKMNILLLSISTVLLLSACSIKSKVSVDYVSIADEAYNQGDYQKAMDNYSKAMANDPANQNLKSSYQDSQLALMNSYLEKGNASLEEMDYDTAYDYFKKSSKLASGDDVKTVKDLVKYSKSQIDKQKELDEYLNWLGPIFKKNTEIANVWSTNIQKLSLKLISTKTALFEFKKMIPMSTELKGMVEAQSFTMNKGLGDLQTKFSMNLSAQQEVISNLSYLTEKSSFITINRTGSKLLNIKTQQAEYIQLLRQYAQSNKLKFTFVSPDGIQTNVDKKEETATSDKK